MVFFGDVRVPDHHSLRSADTADVGVHRVRFFAGLHPEHALGRNREACALHHSFNLRDELGVFLAERRKRKKHRLNHKRLDKSEEHDNRQRNQPEIKPPAPRTAPDHGVQYPHSENAAHNQEELRLGIIQRPRAPTLHRDAIRQRHPVLVSVGGQLQDRDRQDQKRRKNESLNKTIGRSFLGRISKFWAELPVQDDPENEEAVEKADDVETELGAAESFCFLIKIRRKRVGGYFSFDRPRSNTG